MIAGRWSLLVRLLALGVGLVSVLAVAGAVTRSAGSSTRPATVSNLRFPARAPAWLVASVRRSARGLGDPNATLVRLTLGRFPTVVMKGNFTCTGCSRPSNSARVPSGRYASMRFDGITHQSTDFGLAQTLAGAMSGLCNGSACTSRETLLDSAFRALQAQSRAVSEPFDRRLGSTRCKIRLPVAQMKWIWGACSVSMTTGATATVVTFSERWNGLDRSGRRYSPQAPHRHHLWRITETNSGFVKSVSSTGDYPPQWRR